MEKLTSEASLKSSRETCEDSPNVTGSRELEPGHTHYATLDGQMILPYGQAVALAKVSVQSGQGRASAISVTYGPHGSGSFWSAVLTQCLASRLRLKTALLGSTLFRLTWKERVTPSGRVIPALRALGLRTSGSGCTSWPTTVVGDHRGPTYAESINHEIQKHTLRGMVHLTSWLTPNTPNGGRTMPEETTVSGKKPDGTKAQVCLENVAHLASWPTPNTPTGGPNTKSTQKHAGGLDLEGRATLASWATPSTRDYRSNTASEAYHAKRCNQARGKALSEQAHQLTASGPTSNGSGAATKSTGQLNPAFSRWLMGLPPEWCAFAPNAKRKR